MEEEVLKETHLDVLKGLKTIFPEYSDNIYGNKNNGKLHSKVPELLSTDQVSTDNATYNGVGLSYRENSLTVRIGTLKIDRSEKNVVPRNLSTDVEKLKSNIQAFETTVIACKKFFEKEIAARLKRVDITEYKIKWGAVANRRYRYSATQPDRTRPQHFIKNITGFFDTSGRICIKCKTMVSLVIPYHGKIAKLTRPPAWSKELDTCITQMLHSCRKLKVPFEEFNQELKDEILIREL